MSMQFSAKMRRKTYQGFFILTVVSLAGVPAFFKLVFDQGQSIAVVDGATISPREYQEAMHRKENQLAALRARLGSMGMGVSDDMLRSFGINTNTRESALDDLITEKTLLATAEKLHINLDKDFVAHMLREPQSLYQLVGDSIPYQVIDQYGNIDMQRLKVYLRNQGKTIESLDAVIESKMKQQLVLQLVQEAAIISSADSMEYALQNTADKTFKVTTISYAPYVRSLEKQQISPEEQKAFFAKHNMASRRYWTPEKRSGTVWAFRPKAKDAEFEGRFTKEIQGILQAPRESFNSFATQKQAASHAIVGTEESPSQEVQALFRLMPRGRTAFVKDGVGYIVELGSVEKSAELPFERVQQEVLEDLYRERARDWAARIVAAGSTEAMHKEGLIEGSLKSFTARTTAQPESYTDLQKQGIATEKMKRMFLAGQAFTGKTDTASYKVELIKVDAPRDIKQGAHDGIAALERENDAKLTHDFIASLREHATIVMNKSLVKGM
jgi:dephospho-CoA kinase